MMGLLSPLGGTAETRQPTTTATRFHHVIPLLKELARLPIVCTAQFKVLLITYKALYGLRAWHSLNSGLSLLFAVVPLRAAEEGLLCVPMVAEA